ncbi:MAG: squalene synthase HpnC [Acidobacteriota bacterium]|nr:squalene synthase HpnC [Acidobacteriota bacterium]
MDWTNMSPRGAEIMGAEITSAEGAAGFAGLPADYAIPQRAPSLDEAQRYCERLARRHYENFSVATWFLPQRLKQHFFNLYAYCRISDDLGDEVADKREALRLLDEWENELNATYLSLAEDVSPDVRGDVDKLEPAVTRRNPITPRHPVFVALRETIRQLDIPQQPFADLLVAFRSDQSTSRYQTFDDVLGYCRYSANPVGRLVLYLCGYRDAERQQLSDYTCTALQLANFWQDVARDWDKGRIYLPLEDLRRFNVTEDDIAQRRATPEFLALMKFEVARAREWFERGLPLAGKVSPDLATDIELFSRGGQAILSAIERQGYDVLKQRPVISKPRKLALVLRAGARKLFA